MSFDPIRSKRLIARSLRLVITYVLCELLFLAPLDKVAFAADTRVAIDDVLNDAISRTNNMVISMSQGCSGGAHGVPPVNWGSLQTYGNSAVKALNAARLALTEGETATAVQQITSAEGGLDALVNGIHNNCSGGCCGVDPVGFGGYLATRAAIKAKLDVVVELLK